MNVMQLQRALEKRTNVSTAVPPDAARRALARAGVRAWAEGKTGLRELTGITDADLLELAKTGRLFLEQGQYRRARSVFEGLRTLDPNQGYFASALGAVSMAEGKPDEAARNFTEALRLNPSDIAACVNLGEIHLRLGRDPDARQYLDRARTLDPKGTHPTARRARVLASALGQRPALK